MAELLLIPSPLLGPATWAPVAKSLAHMGRAATVVATVGAETPSDMVEAVVHAAGSSGPLVLVPHSNAGL